jgi:tRNA threonylcarbamoyladenosine biosynthesis protein TsaE
VTTFAVGEGEPLDAVAGAVCAGLHPGDVVVLRGPIGAGKTTLVQACARRLGVHEPVTSPTFALAHRYAGDVPVVHLDLYRLAGTERSVEELQAELDGAVAFVEWPEHGPSWLPAPAVAVEIAVDAAGARRIAVERPTMPPCAS